MQNSSIHCTAYTHPRLSYPKVAFCSRLPQHHQVSIGQLTPVRHPQDHTMSELCHPQLHVNLLVGVADVPGQLELPAWVKGHMERHWERWEKARGAWFKTGHIDSIGRCLIRSHQDDHQSSQGSEIHDGDVLKTEFFVGDPHILSDGSQSASGQWRTDPPWFSL